MLIVNRRTKLFLTMETIYFLDEDDDYSPACDVALFYCTAMPPKNCDHGSASKYAQVNLDVDIETLFSNMHKSSRRAVRKALDNKDLRLDYTRNPSDEEIRLFCDSYDEFAASKNISLIDRRHISQLNALKCLAFLQVFSADGILLCGEIDMITDKRCYGAYAFTTFRKAENRNLADLANRLLYWVSMVEGKKSGCSIYDMGGLAGAQKGGSLLGIDAYKLSFGAEIVTEYDYYRGYSLLGKLAVLSMKLFGKRISGWD